MTKLQITLFGDLPATDLMGDFPGLDLAVLVKETRVKATAEGVS